MRSILNALLFFGVASTALQAFDGEISTKFQRTESLQANGGVGSPLAQTGVDQILFQIGASQNFKLAENLTASGTFWVLADTLPSVNPLQSPETKVSWSSKVLEGEVSWELIPGVLAWDVGKKVVHPSSGFFRTPLNLLDRGGVKDGAQAVAKWEEGWIGTEVRWFQDNFTLCNLLIPRLEWTADQDKTLKYFTSQQIMWQNLTRLSWNLFETDWKALFLAKTSGVGLSDSAWYDQTWHFAAGFGFDTNIGDSLTLRGEISANDTSTRYRVTDASTFSFLAETQNWAPQGLLGITWSDSNNLSIMAEYFFSFQGFWGDDYTQLLHYTETRPPGSPLPDLLQQNGNFAAGGHYGFLRLADKLDNTLSTEAWIQMNLLDASALFGGSLTWGGDHWSLVASMVQGWGRRATETTLNSFLWRVGIESVIYF